MKDWPDPDEPKGSRLLFHLEVWVLAVFTAIGFGMAFGPPVIRFARGMM
ncbi:hypothetical protein [Sphingobium cloacae]|nr:hypothetical protein [Sphingobium cloacae]